MKSKSIYKYSLKRRKVLEISENTVVHSPEAIRHIMKTIGVYEQEQENLIAFIVDSKMKVKAFYTVTIGTVDFAIAHAREVFRYAILQGASRIILAHNHPSGDTSPSGKDICLTSEMHKAGKVIGIDLIDHIIVAENNYFSFLEENILS